MKFNILSVLHECNIVTSISGGKDGEAMTEYLKAVGLKVHSYIHTDLGDIEWPESIVHCCVTVARVKGSLKVLRRNDGLGLLELWQRRMVKLALEAQETGMAKPKPFWSSSSARYCTSDTKRATANVYYNSLPNDRIIISAEGLRAEESKDRAKKKQWSIRPNVTSTYYEGMAVEEAVRNFKPGKRLVLNWYPILDATEEEVYRMCGQSLASLRLARRIYRKTKKVPTWWTMHPVYVYGNKRVSCRYCIMGCLSDLQNAKDHDVDGMYYKLVSMEDEGQATFKNGWSLKELK